ncbi:PAS domain S-box protein [Mariprofundus erugo]|uniref:CHASE domain-containing protein n=1 Tax=Mariprofundus erugo TaxID=2528639 RepID=UPI0010FDBA65|nr:PAS domain S-box protein [Mariprofundus erugo]
MPVDMEHYRKGVQPVLIATLIMTVLVSAIIVFSWHQMVDARQQHLNDEFRSDIAEIRVKIAERMTAYSQILKGGRSLFLASSEVTRQEWHTYVSSLQLDKDYRGIQGVGYAMAVTPDQLSSHEEEIRREGFRDYRIWPEGERDLYTAIVYLEPFDWRNQRAFGYDMFAQSTRHEAMARARDSGEPSLSGKVLLVQETNEEPQAGTLLYVPLYRKDVPLETVAQRRDALLGWIYSPYRMDDLIEGMLGSRASDLRLQIYDDNADHADNLLYDSQPNAAGGSLISFNLPLETAGRVWQLRFQALPAYAEAIGIRSLVPEMAGMVLIGLLLIALTWNLFNTQRRASRLAHQLTASLRQSEERWSFALEGSGDGVWDWNISTGKVFFSPRFRQILGLEEGDLEGSMEGWKQRLHAGDVDMVEHELARHLRGESSEYVCEYRIRHRNGRYIWVLGRGRVISYSEDGTPLRLVGTTSDISRRRQAEEKIRLLSQSVHQSGEAIMMTDATGMIEYVNPAFTTITGYSEAEAVGQTPRLLNSGAQSNQLYAALWATISSGRTWHGRIVDRKKDGSFYPAMLTISPISSTGGEITHYVGIQQSLQEYEDMEARFHQSQKMEAIGTLVGGIAHDFNNTLAGITGNLYLARKRVQEQPELYDRLGIIEQLAFRAAAMIKQLLTFSRKSKPEMTPVAIRSFIKETIKLHRISLPENIELKAVVGEGDFVIMGDVNLLQQVMINLLNNARDALDGIEHPAIEVGLERYNADEQFHADHPELAGDQLVHIWVCDNGHGISQTDLAHVFEPFFTTKGVGKGTGLGLSMVYGAIQSHRGVISIESQMEQGTCVHIYLPLMRVRVPQENEDVLRVMHGQGECILLVDDHEETLATHREVLESLNYRVITATNGADAVDIYRKQQGHIDLVVLDVVMPRMGGKEAFWEIRAIDPMARMMFATGYDRGNVQKDPDLADIPVINKPFVVAELSQVIGRLLKRG